ncbi:MAG: alpha/beta fold hydrolase [Gemmatimonas sp.]
MKPFRSAWWLPGPHAATLWGKFGRNEPELALRWETVEMPDGDFVELARYDASSCSVESFATDCTPRVLVLHGLEGSINSNSVRGIMHEVHRRGWNATVMLYRTCGPTPNRLKRSYHSGETTDPLAIINKLIREQPFAPLGVVGISLGGNVLCKLLGELRDAVPSQWQAAVSISAPYDLARASRYIGRGFGKVYENAFLRSLKPKAMKKVARHTELSSLMPIGRVRTIWDFDDVFTAPVHGFTNAADYYTKSSSLQFLSGIRCPTLLLSAVDDPFLPPEVLDDVRVAAANNADISIEFPANGGHVGFVGGPWPWRPFYYAEWRASEFLASHFHALKPSVPEAQSVTPETIATAATRQSKTFDRDSKRPSAGMLTVNTFQL